MTTAGLESKKMGQVIRLRPRGASAAPHRQAIGFPRAQRPERVADEHEDYRHRMIANAAAFAICVLLVVVGVWIADTMAQMRKNQDCVLSGRRGCTPVDVPVSSRW